MDAQQLLTSVIVLAAAGYLIRRTWRRWSGRGIGSCGRCSVAAGGPTETAKPLIPVETLMASADRKSGPR